MSFFVILLWFLSLSFFCLFFRWNCLWPDWVWEWHPHRSSSHVLNCEMSLHSFLSLFVLPLTYCFALSLSASPSLTVSLVQYLCFSCYFSFSCFFSFYFPFIPAFSGSFYSVCVFFCLFLLCLFFNFAALSISFYLSYPVFLPFSPFFSVCNYLPQVIFCLCTLMSKALFWINPLVPRVQKNKIRKINFDLTSNSWICKENGLSWRASETNGLKNTFH